MKIVSARYLIKCDVPGCSNIAKNLYSQGDDGKVNGLAICEKCIREISLKIKQTRSLNGKENN